MTEDEMKEQMQAAQDMLETVAAQRDAASNQVVQLNARVKALERKIQKLEAPAEVPVAAAANGHDAEAIAIN